MRRYAFYLSVTLLAFGTGIFFLYLFSLQSSADEIDIQAMLTENFVTVFVSNDPSLHQQTGIDSLISDKEKAILLFEPTLKKWLNEESIAETIKPSSKIIERIAATKLHQYQAGYLTRMARKSYKPSLLDLSDNDLSELSILINCEEPGGCELWLFREVEGDFEVILRTTGMLEKFDLTEDKSKGFSDIETSYRPAESDSEVLSRFDIYKFNGQKYTLRGCFQYLYRYRDEEGKLRKLKKPIIHHLDDCC